MAVTIDELQIEIQAKGAESASGIDALTTSLAALKKMVNKTLTNKLGELSSALDKIKVPITVNMNVKGMEQLKGAVKSATSNVLAGAITPTVDGTAVSGELDKISGSAAQAAGELEQLVSPASKAKSELDGAGKTAQGTAADMDSLREEAAKLGYTLENVKGLNELRKTAKDAGFALRKVSGKTNLPTVDGTAVSGELDKISGSAAQAAGELEQLVSPATKVANELRATGKSAGDAEKKLKEVGKSAKQGASGLSKFVSSLKRILMYRVVRSILSNIASAAKEGIQNLVLYSKAIGGIDASNANATMSQFASIGMQVKNTLGSALMPVLNALMPVIQTLANWFIIAANAVNQFFAAISGASTWTRAKEYAVDYAAGLNKASGAAKDLKKQLLPFDELNILQDNSTSGGGGGGGLDYGDMFEETEIGGKISEIAEKIKPILDWMKENLDIIKGMAIGIGIALLGWKLAGGFTGGIAKLLGNLKGVVAGVLTIAGAAALVGGAFDAWVNGVDWQNLLFMIGGTAAIVAGLAIKFGGVGAAVGLLVGGIVALVVGLKGWITMGELSTETFVALEFGILAVGGALAILISPWALVVAAVAAAALAIYKYWDEIKSFLSNTWAAIRNGIETAWNGIKNFFTATIPKIVSDIVGWFKELPETLKNVGKNMIYGLWNGLSEGWSGLSKWWSSLKLDGFKIRIPSLSLNWDAVDNVVARFFGVTAIPRLDLTWIDAYAKGGFPTTGQLFFANENGPEMVGNMGSKTTVANNDQIVEGIANGVASANEEQNFLLREQNALLRRLLDKDTSTYLDGKKVSKAVSKYQRDEVRAKGGIV